MLTAEPRFLSEIDRRPPVVGQSNLIVRATRSRDRRGSLTWRFDSIDFSLAAFAGLSLLKSHQSSY